MNICRPAPPKTNGKTERVNCVPEGLSAFVPQMGPFSIYLLRLD